MEKKTNTTINTTKVMDYNNCVWVNHYDRYGELASSTPHATYADAIASVEDMLALINPHFSERLRFTRKSGFSWSAPAGSEIRIETKGDLFKHIADEWVGISANYDIDLDWLDKMTHDKTFLMWLFGVTLLDTKKMFAYADMLYGKKVDN